MKKVTETVFSVYSEKYQLINWTKDDIRLNPKFFKELTPIESKSFSEILRVFHSSKLSISKYLKLSCWDFFKNNKQV